MAIQQDIKAAIIDDIITTGGGATSTTIKELTNYEFGTNYTTKQIYNMLSYISKMPNSPIIAQSGIRYIAWYKRN